MKIHRIIIGGTSSGVGKTTVTTAIIVGLKKLGYSVQPFKVGPDFIDTSYLSAVSGNIARNLDPWLMGPNGVQKCFKQNSKSDFSVIEGVMGFFDGFSGDSNFASTFHVANILKCPVILILDVSKTARSVAAITYGFTKFQKNSRITGLILNNVGSQKHENLCKEALEPLKIPIVGVIPNNSTFIMKSRHLGLIPILEQQKLQSKILKIGKLLTDFIDIQKLIQLSNKVQPMESVPFKKPSMKKTTIAVALDESFNFYYQDNLDALKKEGANLIFFSPLVDVKIPECDGIYLGGGFPEIMGKGLEKNSIMRKKLKTLAESGLPIYAECGGLMYLSKSIDYGFQKYKMVGLFDVTTKMQKKLKLNYTKANVMNNCLIAKKSDSIQGHEFHYSELESVNKDSKFAYELSRGIGIKNQKDGLILYNSLASYMHLHFSLPSIAKNFVNNCLIFNRR